MHRRAIPTSGGDAALSVFAREAVGSDTIPETAASGQDPSTARIPMSDPAAGRAMSPPFLRRLTAEELRFRGDQTVRVRRMGGRAVSA